MSTPLDKKIKKNINQPNKQIKNKKTIRTQTKINKRSYFIINIGYRINIYN